MNATSEARLAHIAWLQGEYGYPVMPPAPAAAVEVLRTKLRELHGLVLPGTLYEFWSRHDGLAYDDRTLYGVTSSPGLRSGSGVLRMNHGFDRRVPEVARFTIGQSSLDIYALDCTTERWIVQLRGSMDALEGFDDFDPFFERLLAIVINDPLPDDADMWDQFRAHTRPMPP